MEAKVYGNTPSNPLRIDACKNPSDVTPKAPRQKSPPARVKIIFCELWPTSHQHQWRNQSLRGLDGYVSIAVLSLGLPAANQHVQRPRCWLLKPLTH